MSEWLQMLRTWRLAGAGRAVVVTIASVKGSAPRAAGTKMLVTADDVSGTIGGGHLEFTAIDIARGQLEGAAVEPLQRFVLGASLGQCCGGAVNLLFETISPETPWVSKLLEFESNADIVVVSTLDRRTKMDDKLIVASGSIAGTLGSGQSDRAATIIAREMLATAMSSHLTKLGDGTRLFFDRIARTRLAIVLFGAGHVGRALATVLGTLPCSVNWVDTRDDAFPLTLPVNVRAIVTDVPEAEVDAAMPCSSFLVMTHAHALDEQLTERILRRGDFEYFGLIGSQSKRAQFERRLIARDVDPAAFERMTCPIGVDGINGKEPGVIAVAVAAQVLRAHDQRMQRAGHSADSGRLAPLNLGAITR